MFLLPGYVVRSYPRLCFVCDRCGLQISLRDRHECAGCEPKKPTPFKIPPIAELKNQKSGRTFVNILSVQCSACYGFKGQTRCESFVNIKQNVTQILMEILQYKDLDYQGLKKQVDKTVAALQSGDFKSAEVKKMPNTGFFRARLDEKNRLLFKVGQYEGKKYLFILEVIANHAYEKSRFLGGAMLDETKLIPLASVENLQVEELQTVHFINRKARHFHVLDKILSFDDVQQEVFRLPLPLIVIGSAGSGKTALTLEKLKELSGEILYTTLSPFLVENARNLYYANGYDNERQNIEFLSFRDYLASIAIPPGQEIQYKDFDHWISRYQQAYRIRDTYKLFEEFKGVLTGAVIEKPYLSKSDYLNLGIRQSVFAGEERPGVYDLFEKYLAFLKESNRHDTNIVSHQYLDRIQPKYDYVVVDEVQDITNVQLYAILKALKNPVNFWLCGDSNQIVHPNFFSWSNVKTMFYKQDLRGDIIRILATNYRNTPEVTRIANALLKVKNIRFGSIDRESTYLVKPNSANQGVVEFFEDKADIKQDLDKKTRQSARFAVLVMRNEDKAEARKFFNTPLLFSVQEAKGLEYENIILFNIISGNDKEFRELCNGVDKADLAADLDYARVRDKGDKSLEIYKFYVNSLYVAITRAVSNLYVIERSRKHELLELLDLTDFQQKVGMKDQASSMDDWQKEARKLELQGKQEQADEIRRNILHRQEVPWPVLTSEQIPQLRIEALDPELFNKKAKDRLFEYAIFYNDLAVMPALAKLGYKRADNWQKVQVDVIRRLLNDYYQDKPNSLKSALQKYGPDFRNEYNLSPLMLATIAGATNIIQHLQENGADPLLVDNLGRNAFQLAIARSIDDKLYGKKTLFKVYQRLMPDSLRLKVGDRLIKLHNRQMEFFLVNFMLAQQRDLIVKKAQQSVPGFCVDDFITATENYPDHLLAPYRKRRTYISAFLSNNEIFRLHASPTCKGLFFRIHRGFYVVNPVLEIGIGETWFHFYDAFVRLADLQPMAAHNTALFIKFFPAYQKKVQEFLAGGTGVGEAE